MRVQAEKTKPNNNVKNEPISVEPNIKLQCNTPSCNTQNPSSRFLCEECTSKKCLLQSTSEIPDNSIKKIQEKPSAPSRSAHSSSSTIEPKPIKIDSIGSDQKEWCCELCNYEHNLHDNETCVYCEHGRRPKQITSSSTNYSARLINSQTNVQLNKQGNVLFQSVFSGRFYKIS